MSDDITLSKVGKTGVFVVMAPGFYLLTSISLALPALLGTLTPEQTWNALTSLSEKTPWPLSIAIILLSYLLGTLTRAIAVEFADRFTSNIFRKLPAGWISGYRHSLRNDCFPYQTMQSWLADKLQLKFTAVAEEAAHGRYNLWKMELCQLAPEAFAYTQELEARVRLMAGMFWAGCGGAAVAAAAIATFAVRRSYDAWLVPVTCLLIVSAMISTVFGSRIRKVRGDEVSFVFLSQEVLRRRTLRNNE